MERIADRLLSIGNIARCASPLSHSIPMLDRNVSRQGAEAQQPGRSWGTVS
jgi:hypothetical protein